VLTSGCDLPDLPVNLAERLAPAPAVVKGQPLLGLWPSALGRALVDWLTTADDLSMRAWINQVQARRVELEAEPANINRPEDLEAWLGRRPIPSSSSRRKSGSTVTDPLKLDVPPSMDSGFRRNDE
jgi:molybdopterin-guanine dinucleotide biosynthesis protein A